MLLPAQICVIALVSLWMDVSVLVLGSSTVRSPPLGSQAYAMTAALANPGAEDGRSQSQAGSAAHVRRRSSILIDGPLTIVPDPGTRTTRGGDSR
ncbi:hypothetical protein EXIGLDRAFT_437339 [Exidia glandulosa HHB12029]|uniref:Secreted protein n=1 Tax=Exidia glandulosa HHB12029 TaxID=1314781 RepID=A0A165B7X8_EXIGL|nr:hypothetical protein EXIGLDRAFT_437339 [Exidia glandulosa HHB12029]